MSVHPFTLMVREQAQSRPHGMRFVLDCERTVDVDAVLVERTYAGLLYGRPRAHHNAEIVGRAKTATRGIWGKRRTHVVPPAIDASDPAHPALPPVCVSAWLVCHEPIAEGAGSSLVCVWFRGELDDAPLEQVIYEAIRGLQWDELAEDFEGH